MRDHEKTTNWFNQIPRNPSINPLQLSTTVSPVSEHLFSIINHFSLYSFLYGSDHLISCLRHSLLVRRGHAKRVVVLHGNSIEFNAIFGDNSEFAINTNPFIFKSVAHLSKSLTTYNVHGH